MGFFTDLLEDEETPVEETPVEEPVDKGFFVDLLEEEEPEPVVQTGDEMLEEYRTEQAAIAKDESRRTGEGVTGFVGDVAAGVAGGTLRGIEQAYKAIEWVIPSGTPEGEEAEAGARGAAEYFKNIREDNPALFGESKASEAARGESDWAVRGWINPAFESLGMLLPSAVSGLGIAGIGTQFWGGTAQDKYDEAVENEKNGIGEKLTESEKILYGNLGGFAEGGMEAVQTYVGMGMGKILTKVFPKKAMGDLLSKAIKRPGSPTVNFIKDITGTVAAEVPMELTQEYMGQKLDYEFGQSNNDPTWKDIQPVIGAAIVMSLVLGGAGSFSSSAPGKQLEKALSDGDAPPEARILAVQKIHDSIVKDDPELAAFWLETTKPLLTNAEPIPFPKSDATVKSQGQEIVDERELAVEQVGNDELKIAKQIEINRKKERIAAREAEAVADHATTPEGKPGKVAQQQINAEAGVMPAEGEPDADGVIAPVIDKTVQSLQMIEDDISRLEGMIAARPDHKNIEQMKLGLVNKKALRETIISQQQETVKAEKAAVKEAEQAALEPEPVKSDGIPVLTEEKAEAKIEPAKPITPVQASKQLVDLGAERIVDGDQVTWEIDTPDGTRISVDQEGSDSISVHAEIQAAIGEQQVENVAPAASQAAEPVKTTPLEPKAFKKSKDFQETGNYEHPDLPGYKVYRDAESKTWGVEKPDGSIEHASGTLFTKKNAVEYINENYNGVTDVAQKPSKGVASKAETKYSTATAEELLIEQDAIPDTVQVTTTVTQADTGANIETQMQPKKALENLDSLSKKLAKILECVKS